METIAKGRLYDALCPAAIFYYEPADLIIRRLFVL